ncbi:anhydro-N-acetylmuramic acid kinase [Oxynema sp. CENA135]|uniref:anhydro-N-acetylmuramic acid kinase n=1 Tax=Oxynema sp. CENA135 TaxID=984206 RepID=UPI001909F36D|nr:anhydro-N-acetylmuramic acid kinase [Oxynema sp. CENA135]MBK4731187.1 anhydro-N-acetylmuramic acid kinase [Oxynema sp. CENA135]
MTRVIGAISGTSVDGIDVALVEIAGTELDLEVNLLAARTHPYPHTLQEEILAVCGGKPLTMAALAELDDAIAGEFARAALSLLPQQLPVDLIGSHGQTVYHRPPVGSRDNGSRRLGYSLQLGRGEAISQLTGITTVSNFRAADIAAGGEGAPLVPKVDRALLGDRQKTRCVQNLGGIGNVAYLPPRSNPHETPEPILGWDTGPANSLLDLAVRRLSRGQRTYDRDGAWAATGTPCEPLVERWLQEPFFQHPPPKSTGRELFGPDYLDRCWQEAQSYALSDEDFLATLVELTVASIAVNYRAFLPVQPDEVLLCGGGSRNLYLKQRLQARLAATSNKPVSVLTTDDVGLNADFKEAIAFAVLAYWRVRGIPGNLPECTGAETPRLLGEIHRVPRRSRASIECQ